MEYSTHALFADVIYDAKIADASSPGKKLSFEIMLVHSDIVIHSSLTLQSSSSLRKCDRFVMLQPGSNIATTMTKPRGKLNFGNKPFTNDKFCANATTVDRHIYNQIFPLATRTVTKKSPQSQSVFEYIGFNMDARKLAKFTNQYSRIKDTKALSYARKLTAFLLIPNIAFTYWFLYSDKSSKLKEKFDRYFNYSHLEKLFDMIPIDESAYKK